LEKIQAGLVNSILLDGVELNGIAHTVGLKGEVESYSLGNWTSWTRIDATCQAPVWLRGYFSSRDILSSNVAALAIDITPGIVKGQLFVNGHMLGRYWSKIAKVGACNDADQCTSESYVGNYGAEKCRTGCGEPSQSLYKLPLEYLYPLDNPNVDKNVIVVLEESGSQEVSSPAISLVKLHMEV